MIDSSVRLCFNKVFANESDEVFIYRDDFLYIHLLNVCRKCCQLNLNKRLRRAEIFEYLILLYLELSILIAINSRKCSRWSIGKTFHLNDLCVTIEIKSCFSCLGSIDKVFKIILKGIESVFQSKI